MRKYYVRWLNNCQNCELVYTCNDAEDTEIAAWQTNCDEHIIYGNDEISFSRITRKEALYLARCHGIYIYPWYDYREPNFCYNGGYDFDNGRDYVEAGYIVSRSDLK